MRPGRHTGIHTFPRHPSGRRPRRCDFRMEPQGRKHCGEETHAAAAQCPRHGDPACRHVRGRECGRTALRRLRARIWPRRTWHLEGSRRRPGCLRGAGRYPSRRAKRPRPGTGVRPRQGAPRRRQGPRHRARQQGRRRCVGAARQRRRERAGDLSPAHGRRYLRPDRDPDQLDRGPHYTLGHDVGRAVPSGAATCAQLGDLGARCQRDQGLWRS